MSSYWSLQRTPKVGDKVSYIGDSEVLNYAGISYFLHVSRENLGTPAYGTVGEIVEVVAEEIDLHTGLQRVSCCKVQLPDGEFFYAVDEQLAPI